MAVNHRTFRGQCHEALQALATAREANDDASDGDASDGDASDGARVLWFIRRRRCCCSCARPAARF